ncbi:hypothetical protein FZW96_15435 [Bacillus sp. BGMRC 2118]|nr:hypothetical protein FZW96_15435 [Bacillus sp. BGMRC 2118]
MQKNARGYVQDSASALDNARESLQNALQTVEKDTNRTDIEETLNAVEAALQQCNQTVSALESQ